MKTGTFKKSIATLLAFVMVFANIAAFITFSTSAISGSNHFVSNNEIDGRLDEDRWMDHLNWFQVKEGDTSYLYKLTADEEGENLYLGVIVYDVKENTEIKVWLDAAMTPETDREGYTQRFSFVYTGKTDVAVDLVEAAVGPDLGGDNFVSEDSYKFGAVTTGDVLYFEMKIILSQLITADIEDDEVNFAFAMAVDGLYNFRYLGDFDPEEDFSPTPVFNKTIEISADTFGEFTFVDKFMVVDGEYEDWFGMALTEVTNPAVRGTGPIAGQSWNPDLYIEQENGFSYRVAQEGEGTYFNVKTNFVPQIHTQFTDAQQNPYIELSIPVQYLFRDDLQFIGTIETTIDAIFNYRVVFTGFSDEGVPQFETTTAFTEVIAATYGGVKYPKNATIDFPGSLDSLLSAGFWIAVLGVANMPTLFDINVATTEQADYSWEIEASLFPTTELSTLNYDGWKVSVYNPFAFATQVTPTNPRQLFWPGKVTSSPFSASEIQLDYDGNPYTVEEISFDPESIDDDPTQYIEVPYDGDFGYFYQNGVTGETAEGLFEGLKDGEDDVITMGIVEGNSPYIIVDLYKMVEGLKGIELLNTSNAVFGSILFSADGLYWYTPLTSENYAVKNSLQSTRIELEGLKTMKARYIAISLTTTTVINATELVFWTLEKVPYGGLIDDIEGINANDALDGTIIVSTGLSGKTAFDLVGTGTFDYITAVWNDEEGQYDITAFGNADAATIAIPQYGIVLLQDAGYTGLSFKLADYDAEEHGEHLYLKGADAKDFEGEFSSTTSNLSGITFLIADLPLDNAYTNDPTSVDYNTNKVVDDYYAAPEYKTVAVNTLNALDGASIFVPTPSIRNNNNSEEFKIANILNACGVVMDEENYDWYVLDPIENTSHSCVFGPGYFGFVGNQRYLVSDSINASRVISIGSFLIAVPKGTEIGDYAWLNTNIVGCSMGEDFGGLTIDFTDVYKVLEKPMPVVNKYYLDIGNGMNFSAGDYIKFLVLENLVRKNDLIDGFNYYLYDEDPTTGRVVAYLNNLENDPLFSTYYNYLKNNYHELYVKDLEKNFEGAIAYMDLTDTEEWSGFAGDLIYSFDRINFSFYADTTYNFAGNEILPPEYILYSTSENGYFWTDFAPLPGYEAPDVPDNFKGAVDTVLDLETPIVGKYVRLLFSVPEKHSENTNPVAIGMIEISVNKIINKDGIQNIMPGVLDNPKVIYQNNGFAKTFVDIGYSGYPELTVKLADSGVVTDLKLVLVIGENTVTITNSDLANYRVGTTDYVVNIYQYLIDKGYVIADNQFVGIESLEVTGLGVKSIEFTEHTVIPVNVIPSDNNSYGIITYNENGYFLIARAITVSQLRTYFNGPIEVIAEDGSTLAENDVVPALAKITADRGRAINLTVVYAFDANSDGQLSSLDYFKIKSVYMSEDITSLSDAEYVAVSLGRESGITVNTYIKARRFINNQEDLGNFVNFD